MQTPAPRRSLPPEAIEKIEQVLVTFVQAPQWPALATAAPPEDNPEWRAGYEAALGNLREELKPWWPFAQSLDLTRGQISQPDTSK